MSDTRWAKVNVCNECQNVEYLTFGQRCGLAQRFMIDREPGGLWTNCPLPRAGDIPEVRALIRAAKEYIICQTTIFEDALDEALDPFADKGEEK